MRFPGSALFAITVLTTVSCVDIPKYDFTPTIEFVGIDKFEVVDSFPTGGVPAGSKTMVRITLSFEDGDGDLGENVQSQERRDFLEANGGWGNYQAQVFRLRNEQWEEYPLANSEFLVFPILKTDGVRGPIRGRLDYDLDLGSAGQNTVVSPVKFLVKIRDRELRESNVVETDTLHIPLFEAD